MYVYLLVEFISNILWIIESLVLKDDMHVRECPFI